MKRFINNPRNKKSIIRLLKSVLSYSWDRKRWTAFKAFRRDFLNESRPCETASQIADLHYDAFLMGSDQIWNYNITGGRFDPVFGVLPGDPLSVVYGASSQDTPFPLNAELAFQELSGTKAPVWNS